MGRVDRRGAEGSGEVTRGGSSGLLPVEVTDSALVLDVAGAFRLVGTGPPFGGIGGAVMAGRRRIERSSEWHGN